MMKTCNACYGGPCTPKEIDACKSKDRNPTEKTTEDQLAEFVKRQGEKIEEQGKRIAALAADLDACVKECTELKAENSALTAQVERLRDGLKRLQYHWVNNDGDGEKYICAGCCEEQFMSCSPNCWLDALIKEGTPNDD
jgi:erythromycin esterase-like protein